MNSRAWMGDDERDELTEPDPLPCESCGAAHDEECAKDCGCKYCRIRDMLTDPAVDRAIPAQREGR